MSKKVILNNKDVSYLAEIVSGKISELFERRPYLTAFGIPRGGSIALYAVAAESSRVIRITDNPEEADFFMDDIIDSGATRLRYLHKYPDKPFFALIDNSVESSPFKDAWVVFPWEGDSDGSIEDNITRLIQFIGEDPTRQGLLETPKRVAKAWQHWTSGYSKKPEDILKVFEDGADGCDEMVIIRDIPFYSHCVIGSTFVETPKGRVPISKLTNGDLIYTMNPLTMELAITKCVNPRITQRNAKLVSLHTDNDTLICTPDHKILLTTGEWKEAQNLKNGDRLASLYRSTETVFSGAQSYSKLIASRYTRWHDGIKINGESKGILEHRFVKSFLDSTDYSDGRSFITHHINEELWDNSPENLEILTIAQHNLAHKRTEKLANNQNRKNAAAIASGREEVREKRSASVKAYWDKLKENKVAYEKRCKLTSDGIQKARNHVVIGVQPLDYTEDVWCMTVPETQLFFANGIAVHNCEHHLAPFFGTASVTYIPDGHIVGLSKISRIVDMFSRRLQVQERLTNQIADALNDNLQPKGVGVVISARHLCMESRGICQQGHSTITSSLRGVLKENDSARAEFLTLIK